MRDNVGECGAQHGLECGEGEWSRKDYRLNPQPDLRISLILGRRKIQYNK